MAKNKLGLIDYGPRGFSKKPDPLFQEEGKYRQCLKCNKTFLSLGNRICPICSRDNEKVAKRVDAGMPSTTGFTNAPTGY